MKSTKWFFICAEIGQARPDGSKATTPGKTTENDGDGERMTAKRQATAQR